MSGHERVLRQALEDARGPHAPALPEDGPIIVYGAGGMGRDMAAALAREGKQVLCLLDRDPAKVGCAGSLPIYHPATAPLAPGHRAKTPVVIAVFNPDADPADIRRALAADGYGQVVGMQRLHRDLARLLGDRYWLTDPAFYAGHADGLIEVLGWWADDASRDLYTSVLRSRLLADESLLPPPSLGDQYFPGDLPRTVEPVFLVDCGAFTGDTVADAGGRVELGAVCAFEPDPANFRRLEGTVRQAGLETKARLWPSAVGERSGSALFGVSMGGATREDPEGGRSVPCVALDDVISDFPVTLLKMDIEGAEPAALAGARGLIHRWHPRLAVCVYHRPEHLWTIPGLVRSFGRAYDLHLRLHRFNGFDLVLYALPRQEHTPGPT